MDIHGAQRGDAAHGLGPTRARVLALLQDTAGPMTAAAAAERLGLHVNSARFHLDALALDGMVRRNREKRSTPGRPKVLYAAVADAPHVAHRSYRLLAEILSGALADRLPEPAVSAEEAGRAWGRHLTGPPPAEDAVDRHDGTDALASVVASMGRFGFDSHVVDDQDSFRLEVSHCPFLEVAAEHLDVVCSVHLGLIRGALEQSGAGVTAGTLEPLVEPSRCIAHLVRGAPATVTP
ncbi:helix-turn-helix domain-containing protein [Nocardioides mesophilus]|uniref:Helix-turn-helix domain-containing protein n=2 Tax=Nocardioides mesophilus TaxID=433659 RepID=A0A7G9RHV3_9ACTN|nr:helix-turn-helix domain-containing protein [Nocardioides mesophilus]